MAVNIKEKNWLQKFWGWLGTPDVDVRDEDHLSAKELKELREAEAEGLKSENILDTTVVTRAKGKLDFSPAKVDERAASRAAKEASKAEPGQELSGR